MEKATCDKLFRYDPDQVNKTLAWRFYYIFTIDTGGFKLCRRSIKVLYPLTAELIGNSL
ncbi:MAG: hypothetical protein IPF69_06685 [Chitinophagaceae bacterium]|nr:hypothetical protein [Chitinophagaceae bacterium]